MSSESYGDPATRTRILEATRELVATHGASVKLSQVAARAEVSRQAVYLHFGDRTGLLVALVRHMDQQLNLGPSIARILEATTGAEVIARTMSLHAGFNAAIDSVAVVLEGAQYDDPALGAAWRDRMGFRRQAHRAIVQRIDELGELSDIWTVDTAADLFYAVTLLGPWRELTREFGYTSEEYVDHLATVLRRALLAGGQAETAARGRA